MEAVMKIEELNGVKVVSTRTVSEELGVQHKNLIETIEKYAPEIEASFARVAFKTEPLQTAGGIQNSKVAYLTEDQAIFVSTLSRNSQQVVQFKARLVQAFQAARKFIQQVAAPMEDDSLIVARALQITAKQLEAATTRAKLLEQNNEMLEAHISELQPKANYAMEVLDADKCYTATEIASQLGKSAQWLNKQLEARKIIRFVNGSWVITAQYASRGFHKFRTKLGKDRDGNPKSYTDMLYTETGRQHIHGLFNPKLNPTPPVKSVAA